MSANSVWTESLRNVMLNGADVKVRGMKTKEILNDVFVMDMNAPVIHNHVRKLSYKFMAAEAYWITSGGMLTEEIAPYNKHIANFSDDGYIFNGAYGPMFISQVEHVVNSFKKDLNTRQAVITIWVPNPIHSKDYRCTISMIFQIRNNRMHTTVQMRSNDLYLGRPYDIFNFTIMTLRVLTQLNAQEGLDVGLGELTLNTASAHIYEQHFGIVEDIIERSNSKVTMCVPKRLRHDWYAVVRSLLDCRDIKETKFWRIRP